MNELATIDPAKAIAVPPPPRRSEIRVVHDAIAVLDTARFEHMQRIANVMAHSNLIPDSLCAAKNENGDKEYLPIEQVTANCFLVVNQSVRWNMDPFAVAQCVSVVHGKLCYEGKLIAAVLDSKIGVDLEYEISGQGDAMKVVVSATRSGQPVLDSKGNPKIAEGTVGDWKTTNSGSPWSARGGHPRMLRYRGAREWCRIHAPGLMLGVYSDDEMEDLNASYRVRQQIAREEPPAPPSAPVTQQVEEVPVSKPVEDLVSEGANNSEAVEWSEASEPEEEAPPMPPKADVATVAIAETPVEQVTTVVDSFPGDKPLSKPNDDGLDIPANLRRTKEPAKTDDDPVDVEEWLKELGNALSGCEGTEQLSEVQTKYQEPMKGKVSKTDWARSHSMVLEAFNRICVADDE